MDCNKMFELRLVALRRCKLVKMITPAGRLAREKHKRLFFLLALVSLVVVVCCCQVAAAFSGTGDNEDDQQQQQQQQTERTAADNIQELAGMMLGRQAEVGVDTRTSHWQGARPDAPTPPLLLLLALREFCSRHPTDCEPSESDAGQMMEQPEATTTTTTTQYNTRQSSNSRLPTLRKYAADDNEEEPRNQIEWQQQQQQQHRNQANPLTVTNRQIDEILRLAAAAAELEPASTPTTHPRRARREPGGLMRGSPGRTYRVSLEEARRFVRAHQSQAASFEMGTMAPAMLFAASAPRSQAQPPNDQPQQQQQHRQQQQQPVASRRAAVRLQRSDQPTARLQQPLVVVVPKRTVEQPIAAGTTTITSTSDHQLAPLENDSQPRPPAATNVSADAMSCNLRFYNYRATKTDGRGNTCTGLVRAAICYGGCDSGEIADWLFPYKKPIHRVCRHGARQRKRVILSECLSVSGQPIEDSLREYHFVDARECICKKCTASDTNCLGTMTQPHLQTVSETVAELGGGGGGGGGD